MQAMTTQTPLLHANERYLVLGLGLSGLSAARYLLDRGYAVTVRDDRPEPPGLRPLREAFPGVSFTQGPLDTIAADDFDCLVVSPGLSVRQPALRRLAEQGKRIIGDIELFAEAVDAPVIAITGSNGKSTVTRLVGSIFEAAGVSAGVGGNIGTPALDLLGQGHALYVLELSSFQLETTRSLRPLAATVLNISEDHLDRYEDLADYRRTKLSLLETARIRVCNRDADNLPCTDRAHAFSLSDDTAAWHLIDHKDETWLGHERRPLLPVSALKIQGRHNWANALAAMALAEASGRVDERALIEGVTAFAGLPHRSEWLAEIDGVLWINDSKGTNPGATRAALEGLERPVILLAGGQGKGADMTVLVPALRQRARAAILFGEDAPQMERVWAGACALHRVEDLPQAVALAQRLARPGDAVLLSPACASFDQYPNFAERGAHFRRLVEGLS